MFSVVKKYRSDMTLLKVFNKKKKKKKKENENENRFFVMAACCLKLPLISS